MNVPVPCKRANGDSLSERASVFTVSASPAVSLAGYRLFIFTKVLDEAPMDWCVKLGLRREPRGTGDPWHADRRRDARRLDSIAVALGIGAPAGMEVGTMASITIRNLDDDAKTRPRVRAASA